MKFPFSALKSKNLLAILRRKLLPASSWTSSPDAEPFIQAGDEVEPETTLCIIEAMKVMNEIKAETKLQIIDVLAQNGEPVEFGQPLFLIAV